MSRSLAQKRAQHALACVSALNASGKYGNYVPYVKALPATIIISGLGQALAMEKAAAHTAKGDAKLGHENLFSHLNDWLCKGWPNSPNRKGADVLVQIIQNDEADYVRAQAEALAYLDWLKKLAVAQLVSPDEGEDT